MAPTGASVSVEMNRPIAARPSRDALTRTAASAIRSEPAASDSVVPDSVVTGPIGNRMEPAMRPARATANVATKQKTITAVPLSRSSRVRPHGRARTYLSVPRLASPATVSPATIATARGRKNGRVIVRPTSAAKTPLLVIWSKKRGPEPGLGPLPEMRTATATATGTAASTSNNTLVRTRRNSSPNSASHIESLSGESHERVFEAARVRREAPDPDARQHERTVALFRASPVELGRDERARDGDRFQSEVLEHLRRVRRVDGLDPQHGVALAAKVR